MDDYQPYVTAAERKRQAQLAIERLQQDGYELQPIAPFGGAKIAKSFWGHAWCRHLESFSDYENRLPRGRSYLRQGSVAHLELTPGQVQAIVVGSETYHLNASIAQLPTDRWETLKKQCTGKIASLVELLQGKLSQEVMRQVTHPEHGLFPLPHEIKLSCDCPDHADLCKHLAAILYGIGRRLDDSPELLFTLRGVDQSELIADRIELPAATSSQRRLDASALGDVFGIDIDTTSQSASEPAPEPLAPQPPTPPRPKPIPKANANAPKKKFTGLEVAQLRDTFGMTAYEFAIIAQVSPTTVSNWDSKGDAPLRLSAKNAATLANLATLTPEAAWDRLNEFI